MVGRGSGSMALRTQPVPSITGMCAGGVGPTRRTPPPVGHVVVSWTAVICSSAMHAETIGSPGTHRSACRGEVVVAGDGIEHTEGPGGRAGRLDAVPAPVALGDGGVVGPTVREEGEQQGLVDGVVGDHGDPSPWWRTTRASKPAVTRGERAPRLDAGCRVEAAELGDDGPFEVAGPRAVVAIEDIVDLDHVEARGPGERRRRLDGPPQWTGVHRAQRDAAKSRPIASASASPRSSSGSSSSPCTSSSALWAVCRGGSDTAPWNGRSTSGVDGPASPVRAGQARAGADRPRRRAG